ncbi:MAG: FAD-dependent monooxygenase [Pseudomonadota bacterium]
MTDPVDIAVVGAGLSGLLAAIALADPDHGAGRTVALIDPGPLEIRADDSENVQDLRATSLTPSAVRMLNRLCVALPPLAPMRGMRVGEGSQDTPWQFQLDAPDGEVLAWFIGNDTFRHCLLRRATELGVQCLAGRRIDALTRDGMATLRLDTQETITAKLVVAADGRDSAVRRLAGIGLSARPFEQQTLILTAIHDQPHHDIALERFQNIGAIGSLPLLDDAQGRHRSQIAWSDRSTAVQAAKALPTDALAALIDERLWHELGVSDIVGPRQAYPLTARRADRIVDDRVALIGDAARTIHPLAGLGFNLAIRDIGALTDGLRDAIETGQDIGVSGLTHYERWRALDANLITQLTEGLSHARTDRLFGRLKGHVRRSLFALLDATPSLQPFARLEAAGELGTLPSLLR